MKTNLLQRNEGRPLSSIFLRMFALLAMLVVGMSASWGQTQDLVIMTNTEEHGSWNGSNAYTYDKPFDKIGNVKAVFSGITSGGDRVDGYVKFKMGTQIDITAPSGYVIKYVKVDFDQSRQFHFNFAQSGGSFLKDGNSTSVDWTYADPQNTIRIANRANVQPASSDVLVKSITVRLHKNPTVTIAADKVIWTTLNDPITLTSTITGGESDHAFGEWHLYSSDADETYEADKFLGYSNTGFTFTPSAGVKKSGTDNVLKSGYTNESGPYYIGVHARQNCIGGNGWENSDNQIYTVNVGVRVSANTSPAGLTDAFTIHQSGHNDWVINNGQVVGRYTTAVFSVPDVPGYTFAGWYEGDVKKSDSQTEYAYGNVSSDLTLTAKFVQDLHPDVTCQNNTINLTKIKPYGSTTFNSATGEFVVNNYDQYGNGLTIEFVTPQNMSHVKTITVNGAEFKNPYLDKPDGTAWPSHTESDNKTVINLTGRNDCAAIKKITLRDIQTGTYTISSIVFEYDHKPAMPQFINGTTSEMTIYKTDDLVLSVDSALNTFWREYQDENYKWNEQVYTHIPDNEWNTPIRTVSGLEVGTYYFAAERGQNCEFSKWHSSDLNKVKVTVLPTPTNLSVTYDWNTGSGNPVVGTLPIDNNKYAYKALANIMAPGSVSREGYFFAYWSTNPDGSGTRYSNKSDDGEVQIKVTNKITTLYAIWNKEGFEGYFNYENRLIAQWNIDLADGARLHEPSMDSGTWTKTGPVSQPDGKTKTTYTLNSAINFGELVYGGSNSEVKIPVFAGLKFKANAGEVKIVVTKSGNEIMNTQLVLAKDVQLHVPYVRNSYRDDGGNAQSPYGWKDKFIAKGTTWGGKTYDKDTWGVTYWNEFRPARFNAMQDCIHHINRDIVYIVAQPDIWNAMTNKCYDDETKDLFNSGGDEDVHGLRNGEKKVWKKLNFCGNQGTPCIITFKTETTIDRIGVNRNLSYSYYTENIAATSEGAYTKPFPGLRIIGSPRGAKVADVGDTYSTYGNAIAMTYGGWPHNGNKFQDGDNNTITDGWGNMTVYYGDQTNGFTEGQDSYDANQFTTSIDVKKVPVATDGFPVYSTELSHAYSETVNPTKTSDLIGANVSKSYHDQNYGNFLLHESDRTDGSADKPYVENYNPWTLPCRGAYAKFEPTLPGVLNVHILQEPNEVYYIADEFGRLIKEQIFVKTGTSSTLLTNNNGHISINQKDNVKYSFDVYPGKTYYLFSNVKGMGITGFYFEPYVYRKYHQLSDAPTSREVNGHTVTLDQNEEYELARQDVGLKTATMTAGPVFTFSDATYYYTNQTAEYPEGGTQTNLDENTGAQITKDDGNGNQVPDSETYAAIGKTPAGSYPNQTNNINPLIYNNKAVHVVLDRNFKANTWSTIVLPYSMNNLQLETVFGKGTKVVLLRDVQDETTSPNRKTTVNFVYHENQDIIAGYPYMIYPAQNVSKVETNAYIYGTAADETFKSSLNGYTAPSIVEISGVGPNLVTYPTASNNYGGLSCFKWEASYDNATENMPVGSYVMSDNNLRRVNEGNNMQAGAFKGYLKYVGEPSQANRRIIDAISFGADIEDDATVIENMLFNAGIVGDKTNVYSINGQLIRENTDDLRGLEKGIYIVNGKKYIVR